MYALVAFYYLDQKIFENLKKEFQGKGIQIKCMSGCIIHETSSDELIKQIEAEMYITYIPNKKKVDQDIPSTTTNQIRESR